MSEGQILGMSNPPMEGPHKGGIAAPGKAQVHAAIARASQATGVDFQYLLAQARLESSLDPSARAGTSSAAGLYQFTSGTWLNTVERHGAEHGMSWASDAIQGGAIADPAMRSHIMGLRYDPQFSALMAGELAADNRADLTAQLDREPDAAELYLAHFLGSAGASQFLTALAANPGQSAVTLLPKAAAANRSIFFASGQPRSVGEVMALMRGKVAGAMQGGSGVSYDLALSTPTNTTASFPVAAKLGGPVSQEFHGGQTGFSAPVPRSMADTLRSAFGGAETATPGHVRTAYAKLARLGL